MAKQRHGLGGPNVRGFPGKQIPHVGAGFGDAEQTGFAVDQMRELRRGQIFGAGQVADQSRIKIAGPDAHHHPGRWLKTHGGVDAPAIFHSGQIRAVAQVGQDNPPGGRGRVAQPAEFLQQISVGQAMKAIPPDTLGVLAPWEEKQLATRGRVW